MSTNPNPFGGGGQQPYQFLPESYGALGNGKVVADVVTNSTTTITSATANFTSADIGKFIMIHGALSTTSGPLITTIASVTSPTTAILNLTATASVSGCPAVYGTDDTAAVASAVSHAGTYALANDYFAEVVFGAKIYVLATGPTQTGDGSTLPTFNSQVPLPYPAANGTSRKLIIQLTGSGDAGHLQFWMSLSPNVAGTALVSMVTAPKPVNVTFGVQSVIGGPTSGAGFTSNQGQAFANVKAVIRNMSVWCPIYTNLCAYDFGYVSQMRAQQSSAHMFAPTGVNAGVQPYLNNISAGGLTNSISIGWRTPVNQNNDDIVMDDVTAEGYEIGFEVFDHFQGGRMAALYCDVALNVNRGGGVGHLVSIQNMSAEAYNGGLLTNGLSTDYISIDINWSAECGSVTYDLSDPSNYLRGYFSFEDPADPGRGITITGASNLKIINNMQARGHMASPPAVPASTVAAALVYRDAMVVVHTGAGVTVSAITVDGTATSQTVAAASSSVPVAVPSGKTVALTYAGGTPTWDWWLN